MDKIDLSQIDAIIAQQGTGREAVIPILQAIQKLHRYLPEEALKYVCEHTDITPSLITGVSTFYMQFRHTPAGTHTIRVCHGTACHVKNAGLIQDALEQHLHLSETVDTDPDGIFTVEKVACLGCCTLAPVIQIDTLTYGHLTPDMIPVVLQDFLNYQKQYAGKEGGKKGFAVGGDGEIRICLDSCCIARGTEKVYKKLVSSVAQLKRDIRIKNVGCVGMCHQTPLVEIVTPDGQSRFYACVQEEDVPAIVDRHFNPKGITNKIGKTVSHALDSLLTDETWEPVTRYSIDVREEPVKAFFNKQTHIASEHLGDIDPLDIQEYQAHGGFEALKKCLRDRTPEKVIETVKKSRLRGRGGAGFPTGRKWELVRSAVQKNGHNSAAYIVCNGDEGDPGAFMDRMLLESYPYRIIEGIIIAAYAVGAQRGYCYIRAEYPHAVVKVRQAIKTCEEAGFIGDRIAGTDFSFKLTIMEGAGAFVCGEETALIASIEGKRGMPRLRPPYPANEGLWKQPTLVNNAETYAMVPWIFRNGADAFAGLGTAESAGTKVFAVAGKVNRIGLIEIPMGLTIREVVDEICGGIPDGKKLKAVQIGGPSGGCVPAHLADTPIDYEALTTIGAIMGSGGLVVLDETDCMVDIARYFLEFTQDQSCGRCTYCRIGTKRMLEILERLCRGEGRKGDIEQLEHLCELVQKGSLCGLGQTAPNPVLTTLRYFRDEYEAHIEKRCPAGKCRSLITFSITEDCIGCTLCAQNCPTGAIQPNPYQQHEINSEFCVRCGACRRVCPVDAVKVE